MNKNKTTETDPSLSPNNKASTNKIIDWLMRMVKGIFIGTGFILPGISGGALAAVFGIYERLISFLSNLKKDFLKNLLFFIPVGIGGLIGIVLVAKALSPLLANATYEVYVLWFFIGCMAGTFPTLFRQANKKGHLPKHRWIMIVAAVLGYIVFRLLSNGSSATVVISANPVLRFLLWVVVGVVIGLGTVIPGLSPSNILVFLGFYTPMVEGFKSFDLAMMIPLFLGVFACVLALSKVMAYFFKKAYTTVYFIILGIVLASTIMIIPFHFNYLSWGTLICLLSAFGGALLAYLMTKLEDKYKPEEEF
ncbi:MAG: DUF368 domain-containing protein [Clostridiales bacterium]|nr:DUF368 domain-containing protein [Clostridiales bacterium]